MLSPVLPGAHATRQTGILSPTSEGTLNRQDGCPSPTTKRADSLAMDHLLKPTIALKPHPPNLHVQPRVLQPLLLLPREHVSLSYLDLEAPHGDLPPSKLYESHIKILDLESRIGAAPKVLVARNDVKGTLYALERHDNGLYTACKLNSWVDPETFIENASVVCQERIRPAIKSESIPAAITTPQTHRDSKKKRVAIEAIQSLVRKRARSQSVSTLDEAPKPGVNVAAQDPVGHEPEQAPASTAKTTSEQTADSIFDNIRSHYTEALYKSKGSLAYFAKGPLSRARSAFHLDLESDLNINDLIDFLKSLVLTTVLIDKKYHETIPEHVSRMKEIVDSSDEGPKKRRRTKKMKVGKDGLYPLEGDSIKMWWAANKPDPKDEESGISAEQIKEHAALLRTRETQLQMIVILEILALEPLKAPETGDALPALPGTESREMPPPKKRNKHNLPVLIDVHTDRLTIWQSMASHEHILLQDSQVSTPLDGQPQKGSSEPLKDFCVDVIVPFYSSRLPQICDSLSRKLGGPAIISPLKSKSKSLKRSRSDQKPGAVARRTALQKEPKTLERALSFEQQHHRSMSRGPSQIDHLMRATSASIPSIKREESDPVKIGKVDVHRRSLSRTSSMTSLDDKAVKKAKIEAELRNAISNLRKPNREVVGQAMEEAAERKVGSAKKTRKPTKPNSVQVKATPMNQRFKDVLPPKAELLELPLPPVEDIIPPSSVGPFVPSTSLRNGFKDAIQNTSPADVVGNTPVKTSQNFLRRPAFEEPAIPPSSPLATRRTAPSDFASGATEHSGIPFTPVKRRNADEEAHKGASIYQQLGWDDDFDDL